MAFGDRFEVAVANGSLVGERWRAEAPTVVFLHAGVADRRSWYAVTELLDGKADSIAYDRRGYGSTPPMTEPFRHLDDLLTLLDAICGSRVIVVGNSMGGGLALDLALVAPDRVKAMLLIAPSVSGAPDIDTIDPATLVLSERIERAEADGDKDQITRLESWLWLDGPGEAEGRVTGGSRRLAEEMSRQVITHAAPDGAGASGIDAWNRLSEIEVPTIVAAGALDVPVLVERSRGIAVRLGDGVFRLLEQTAHLPSLDEPKMVAEIIDEMLRHTG